ncbi:melanopsin-like [Mya arenaria]|uniref:melanopsin-like n=1 Tax=Mya arenaria TaxID=6604 RepID=UPI0022DEBE25|nr:melanopsin-like [Mya arenaria]
MTQHKQMHTPEFPVPDSEMHIVENISYYENINRNWNEPFDHMVMDYNINTGVVATARGVVLAIYSATGLAFNTFMLMAIKPMHTPEYNVHETGMLIFENNSHYENINRNWNEPFDHMVMDYNINTGVVATTRGVVLAIYCATGLAFNTFMLMAILPNRRLHTMRNILLVHLGCTGLIFTICINGVTFAVNFTGMWIGGLIVCEVYGFILMALTLVTSWTITALSWDEYQTIACPLKHPFKARAIKLAVLFGAVWLLACVLSLPPLLGDSRFVFYPETGICFVCRNTLTGKLYIFLFLLAAVYVPLGIMVFCYLNIYKIAKNQISRIAATMIRMTCVLQATAAPSSKSLHLSMKGTKAMYTILTLIGSFVIVNVPMSVLLSIDVFSTKHFHVNEIFLSTIMMLFLSAPVIHSCVYGLRNKTLRISLQRYMRRKILYYCYKDKRKNSVKYFRRFRSTPFMSGHHRQRNQNEALTGAGRRTQSFPVCLASGRVKRNYRAKKSLKDLTVPSEPESMTRPYFCIQNPELEEDTDQDDAHLPDDVTYIDEVSGEM